MCQGLEVAALCSVAINAIVFVCWLRARKHLSCFHHSPKGGWVTDKEDAATSWVQGHLIDLGARKLYECTRCGKSWIT